MILDNQLELARAKGQLIIIKKELKRLEILKKDYQTLVSRYSRKIKEITKNEME